MNEPKIVDLLFTSEKIGLVGITCMDEFQKGLITAS
jgi:TATA-box binding protein (TBP) (component of TFIID and TFIIIB)